MLRTQGLTSRDGWLSLNHRDFLSLKWLFSFFLLHVTPGAVPLMGCCSLCAKTIQHGTCALYSPNLKGWPLLHQCFFLGHSYPGPLLVFCFVFNTIAEHVAIASVILLSVSVGAQRGTSEPASASPVPNVINYLQDSPCSGHRE